MTLPYTLIRTKRRSLSIQINHDGSLIARAPLRMSIILIDEFIEKKQLWIEKHQKRMKERGWGMKKKSYSDDEIMLMKSLLKAYVIPRVRALWEGQNLPAYTSIKITKSEHRWGSCSGKNGLCFSYRLVEYLEKGDLMLSSRAKLRDLTNNEDYQSTETDSSQAQNDIIWFIDAIIVHELAHLREKNHQKPFWNLVYRMMPEYETIMKDYKNLSDI